MTSKRARSKPMADRPCCRFVMAVASVLALTLLFPSPPVARAVPTRLPTSQETPAGSGQVIAQGVTRLPRGEIAWAISRLDLTGEELAIAAFPVGFVLADGATSALLDEGGETLNLLQEGEAAFFPDGKPGALASATDEPASVYQIALLPAAEATSAGVIAGNPFPAPEGQKFDLELSRYQLASGEEATIPAARSGAPALLLQTDGVTQLQFGDQAADLNPGDYAQLPGETLVRGTGDGPTTFVVAAIGEPTAAGAAGRGDRERPGASGGQAGQGESAASGGEQRERRARRGQRGGRGGQAAPQPSGGGTAPITGAQPTEAAPAPAPPAEGGASPTVPQPTIEVPVDGTPAPETPATETPLETPSPTAPADESPTPEVPATETPIIETPIVETPVIETPIVETPIVETPVTEEPPADEPVVETPVTEEPAAESIAPEEPVADQQVVTEPTVEPAAPSAAGSPVP